MDQRVLELVTYKTKLRCPCRNSPTIPIINAVPALCVVVSLVTLVFAGYDRASYSLAYTGMIGAYWVYKEDQTSEKLKSWVTKFQLFSLVVVIVATVYDIAGYNTVPWELVVVCWVVCGCLALWDSAWNFVLDSVYKKGDKARQQKAVNKAALWRLCVALGLVVVSFVIGMWQAIDSGLS